MNRLATASITCLAGAGLALYAATRVWSVQVTERPGLPELRTTGTGADAQPWLMALALIALAAPGALLATRGLLRRLLGGLIVVVGGGIAVATIAARLGTDAGAATGAATLGPIACVGGAALIVVAGLDAARHGHRWPTMGARYERRTVPPPARRPGVASEPSAAPGPQLPPAAGPAREDPDVGPVEGRPTAVDTRAVWDALDRGDDPTTA
jgi:uncharacterized membrane protein (TIGR02234 family)